MGCSVLANDGLSHQSMSKFIENAECGLCTFMSDVLIPVYCHTCLFLLFKLP